MTDDVIPSALDVLTGPVPALSQPRDPADGAARVHARSRRALVSLSTLPSHVGGRDAAAGPSARSRRIARLQLASDVLRRDGAAHALVRLCQIVGFPRESTSDRN